MARRQAIKFPVRAQRDDIRRRVCSRAIDLDRQVFNVAGLWVVATEVVAATERVNRPGSVQRHVAASGADIAAIFDRAGAQIVSEEVVLWLAAIVELVALLVERPGHEPFLPLQNAETAAEPGLWVEVAEMAAGKAVRILAVL